MGKHYTRRRRYATLGTQPKPVIAVTNSSAHTPYTDLPPEAFWRSAVTGRTLETIFALHRPKFGINRTTKIAMAGSCFAQQLSRKLRARGFSVVDEEPSPPGLTPEEALRFGFGQYSARYGNIYTARQLRQLAEEAFGKFVPGGTIWEKDGRYYDALRPRIEPDGLETEQAVREQREYHLRQVRAVISSADVLVFTLGLTETWAHAPSGTVYPAAPGVVAGKYDPREHRLENFTAQEVYDDLAAFRALAKENNPGLKMVLTVSPQRPVATATGKHVMVAAGYSKAALRAAAGQIESEYPDVDYFPSFELATGPFAGNTYFGPNLRTVTDAGAAMVIDAFLASYGTGGQETSPATTSPQESHTAEDAACDEELLEAFAP